MVLQSAPSVLKEQLLDVSINLWGIFFNFKPPFKKIILDKNEKKKLYMIRGKMDRLNKTNKENFNSFVKK